MSTAPLTVRDIKNKILADMTEVERRDSLVGDVLATGGYIILTEDRVIEIYSACGEVYAAEKETSGGGWTPVEYEKA